MLFHMSSNANIMYVASNGHKGEMSSINNNRESLRSATFLNWVP